MSAAMRAVVGVDQALSTPRMSRRSSPTPCSSTSSTPRRQSPPNSSDNARAAVVSIYRIRTGSDHHGFYHSWISGFAESRARLGEDEVRRAEERGLALSYDELVERATQVIRQGSSAPVDERA